MANGVSLGMRLVGDRELMRVLDAITRDGSTKAMVAPMKEGAKVLRKYVQRGVPRRTGRLRRSIRYRVGLTKGSRRPFGVVGPDYRRGGNAAHLVEFGSKPRYRKNAAGEMVSTGQMPAKPFMRPAARMARLAVRSAMMTEARRQLLALAMREGRRRR